MEAFRQRFSFERIVDKLLIVFTECFTQKVSDMTDPGCTHT